MYVLIEIASFFYFFTKWQEGRPWYTNKIIALYSRQGSSQFFMVVYNKKKNYHLKMYNSISCCKQSKI